MTDEVTSDTLMPPGSSHASDRQPCTDRARLADDRRRADRDALRRAAPGASRASPTRPTAPGATPSRLSARRTRAGRPSPTSPTPPRRTRSGRSWPPSSPTSTSATPAASFLDGAARLDLRRDRVPQLAEVSERLTGLTGWRIEPVPGLVPGPALLRLAGRSPVPVDPVHPPPLGALLHTRARRHPRGRRSRQRPGRTTRSPPLYEAAGRASARATSAGGVRLLQPGVLVHASSSAWRGRTASCGPTAPACCRRTASSTPSDAPSCARSTSWPWGTTPTTSRSTSRCCSRPRRSTRSPTGSARSSTATATSAFERLTGRPAA